MASKFVTIIFTSLMAVAAGITITLWQLGVIQLEEYHLMILGGLVVVSMLISAGAILWEQVRPPEGVRKEGTVKWFNPTKGFGFIAQDHGEDLFIHQTEITQAGFRSLSKGDRVEFEVGKGEKGPVAKKVLKVGHLPDEEES